MTDHTPVPQTDPVCADCGHPRRAHLAKPVYEQGTPLWCLGECSPGVPHYVWGCGCRTYRESTVASAPTSTPVPQFDEGQDYVNDLEKQIRSEAVKNVLADIDMLLDKRQERIRWYAREWAAEDGGFKMALFYDRLASEVEQIRREIAEMGEKP